MNSSQKFFDKKPSLTTINKIKKILILDLDACALINTIGPKHTPNTRADMISPSLIEHVKTSKYDEFYVCTHRFSKTTFTAAFSDDFLQNYAVVNPDLDPKNLTTTMITSNLEKALGISCLAVSTPDDFSYTAPTNPLEQCGYGFENIIKPYEAELIRKNHALILAKKYNGYCKIPRDESFHKSVDSKNANFTSKNKQLILIGQHAFIKFPDHNIELYYRDDLENLCMEATKISQEDLPNNIKLFITRDCPYNGIIKNFGMVQGSGLLHVESSPKSPN
jgi:hypothetical protein